MGSTPILSAMKRYLETEIELIKQKRKDHKYSFYRLSQLYGVPASTIRNWCYEDRIYTKGDILRSLHERKRTQLKESEPLGNEDMTRMTSRRAKLFAAIMYWCEGAKYPASNKVAFTNSDPDLIQTFLELLRKGFRLNKKKLRVHLQIHTNQNYEALKQYWVEKLDIQGELFIKPTMTSPNGKKHKAQYYGTCTVRYQDYRLQLKLIGLYEEFARKIGSST